MQAFAVTGAGFEPVVGYDAGATFGLVEVAGLVDPHHGVENDVAFLELLADINVIGGGVDMVPGVAVEPFHKQNQRFVVHFAIAVTGVVFRGFLTAPAVVTAPLWRQGRAAPQDAGHWPDFPVAFDAAHLLHHSVVVGGQRQHGRVRQAGIGGDGLASGKVAVTDGGQGVVALLGTCRATGFGIGAGHPG